MYAPQAKSHQIKAKANQVVDYHYDETRPGRPLFLLIPGAGIALIALVIGLVVAYQMWIDESLDSSTGWTYLLVLSGFYIVGAFVFSYGYELYDIPKALRDTLISIVVALAAVVIIAVLLAIAGVLSGGKSSSSSSSSSSGSSGGGSSGSGSWLSGSSSSSGSVLSGGSGGTSGGFSSGGVGSDVWLRGVDTAANVAVNAVNIGQVLTTPIVPAAPYTPPETPTGPSHAFALDPSRITCPNCGRIYNPAETHFGCPACGTPTPPELIPAGLQPGPQPGQSQG